MATTSSWSDLWAGRLPLPVAFWHYMIFWGFLINLGATFGSLAVLLFDDGGTPGGRLALLAATLHLLPVPYNLACLIGVWRSAGRPEVEPTPRWMSRAAALLWSCVMLVV